MAGPPYSDPGRTSGPDPDAASSAGTPRWVKVFGIVAIIVVLLVIVAMLLGGGGHGPGRHMSSDDAASSAPTDHNAFSDMPGGHRPPAAGH